MSVAPTTATTTTTTSRQPRRHEVEMYAHALRTRLQLASFKALHGVGSACFSDLAKAASTSTVQPLSTSTVANTERAEDEVLPLGAGASSSTASTPALSQSESMPCSSQSSARSSRSIYLDIFGADFRASTSSTSGSTKSLSRTSSFASSASPSRRAAWRRGASSPSPASACGSTHSLLDRAASSPQLGSPDRKNGRFDWHNNPTPAMVAHESKLAATEFALPTGSPSKRRREASHNALAAGAASSALGTPRRVRMQSNGTGGFLPNGHPASSLAQDLGLTTPRTPRSRHASARHVLAVQPAASHDHDQQERDRVATTLAALADARSADKACSSDSSSGSDRPYTPPDRSSRSAGAGSALQHGLGIGLASPGVRRSAPLAHPAEAPPRSAKRHRRNVSWSLLPDEPKEAEGEGEEDRAAADYLLFLASSPSPSSSRRFGEGEVGGILATPAQTSLWDPFKDDVPTGPTGRRSRLLSSSSALGGGVEMTPPPSTRKARGPVGLGFESEAISPPREPRAANAEEFMLLRSPRSPRTPPPSVLGRPRSGSSAFEPTTPPNAPGAPGGDTTFHYADFVNVSPSPQPPSSARFASATYRPNSSHRTPTKSNRFRFDHRLP